MMRILFLSLLAAGTLQAGGPVQIIINPGWGGGCYRPQPVICRPVPVCPPNWVWGWGSYPAYVSQPRVIVRTAPNPSCGGVYRVAPPVQPVYRQTTFRWR